MPFDLFFYLPAEFSSNRAPKHLFVIVNKFLKILISWFGCIWLGLDINFASKISSNRIKHLCSQLFPHRENGRKWIPTKTFDARFLQNYISIPESVLTQASSLMRLPPLGTGWIVIKKIGQSRWSKDISWRKREQLRSRGQVQCFRGSCCHSLSLCFNLLPHSHLMLPHESHFMSEVAIMHNSFS